MERKVAFKALVGSHNYNLAGKDSDKDYKMFVLPTFEDLYKGNSYSKQVITDTEDVDIHDIRKTSQLFYKSNINFVEVLFSSEIQYGDNLTYAQKNLIDEIFAIRHDIAKMNLPYLFNACGGMHSQKMKLLPKGTEGTQHLVDKFGYDTKQALHAYRVLNFIERFRETGYEDFKHAMTYSDEEREFMLSIKDGMFSLNAFENFVNFYHEARFKTIKEAYHSHGPSERTKEYLDEIVMELVKISI